MTQFVKNAMKQNCSNFVDNFLIICFVLTTLYNLVVIKLIHKIRSEESKTSPELGIET